MEREKQRCVIRTVTCVVQYSSKRGTDVGEWLIRRAEVTLGPNKAECRFKIGRDGAASLRGRDELIS